ncbi:MAG: hypothetical protein MJ252_26320, partial [archaeon]|nr:hypothetical protein [archaeon]
IEINENKNNEEENKENKEEEIINKKEEEPVIHLDINNEDNTNESQINNNPDISTLSQMFDKKGETSINISCINSSQISDEGQFPYPLTTSQNLLNKGQVKPVAEVSEEKEDDNKNNERNGCELTTIIKIILIIFLIWIIVTFFLIFILCDK